MEGSQGVKKGANTSIKLRLGKVRLGLVSLHLITLVYVMSIMSDKYKIGKI